VKVPSKILPRNGGGTRWRSQGGAMDRLGMDSMDLVFAMDKSDQKCVSIYPII
jgi:hypothetical protein